MDLNEMLNRGHIIMVPFFWGGGEGGHVHFVFHNLNLQLKKKKKKPTQEHPSAGTRLGSACTPFTVTATRFKRRRLPVWVPTLQQTELTCRK